MHQPEHIQQPQHDGDDTTAFSIDLMELCHGDETIHQPQEDSDDDQNQDNLN